MSQRTAEIQSGVASDAKAVRRLIKRVADDMNSYADSMKTQVAALSAARPEAYAALSNALALQSEFSDEQKVLSSLQNSLHSLIEGTTTAREGMFGMRASTDGLPRISKEINQAKRGVVIQIDALLSEIDNTRSTVTNIIEAIDRMLLTALKQ